MSQLRDFADSTGPPLGKGEGLGGVATSPRSLTEAVFPLPTQSEEKIGADRLGDLASLIEFNPESAVMVSITSTPLQSYVCCCTILIRAHHLTRAQRSGM